ncbi:DnaB-like helicase N-terminal domain-containing protein [Aliarcobacter cryaerophilus]|uniref:AAA family ATPase n=2 Tax=unclassified Arcobacter TaxID=2593671 RepID=A0AA96CLL1_9BACT|nr:AAA family ATPase [Arcobacter sp. AZ-2023]WPD10397.1 AAA family ATPase [Arcobacter sp. DSM 115954]WNL15227.1 AAA family ATPase [Arcobacter sp. AZ-2023]WNL18891.1 AAA family ATPase [Arcobacter sp. AZ-2023]WNL21030.1 AAA family ATPase [Arcobacter sp. AZ-2023]
MINNINYNLKYSVECLLGIERAILSSLITNNNTDKIEDCLKIIEPKDFYYEQHGIIYDSIILLYKNDKRVDENNVFLTNQTNINEQYYIDVIATTPLDSILDSIKKIKQYSLERQLITVAAKIKEGDFSQIINLNNLQEKLDNIIKIKDLKQIDDKFEKFINNYDLDVEKIKSKKIEYLFDKFIIKNDIIMFVARPGVGKSLMALALCNMLLDAKKVKRVFYLDGDNSHITIKSRNIDLVKDKFGNRLNYFIELSDLDLYRIITELKNKDLSDILIVFDSIKNFIIGDRNSHKDVTDLMKKLKELRNNSATVIFLHHQNKLKKDFNSAFAGSSAFMEDISLAYELKRNADKQTYIFTPLKDRNNIASRIAFQYNNDNTLTEVDYIDALETKEDIEIKEIIIAYIKKHKDKPIYSEILKHLVDYGYSKDRVNKIIQNGKNVCWKVTQLTQNNKTIYSLIDNEDNQDKSIQGSIK